LIGIRSTGVNPIGRGGVEQEIDPVTCALKRVRIANIQRYNVR
jgi:hypothetical protein